MADDDLTEGEEANRWYIARQGQPHGPVMWGELLDLLYHGQVSAADFVWREGLDEWVLLGSLPGVAEVPQGASAMPRCPPPPVVGPGPSAARDIARPAAALPRPRRGAPRGWLVAAMIVTAMAVAGAIGWSLHSLSQANRQTAEAEAGHAGRTARAGVGGHASRAPHEPADRAAEHSRAASPADGVDGPRQASKASAAPAVVHDPIDAHDHSPQPKGKTDVAPPPRSPSDTAPSGEGHEPPKTEPPPPSTDVKPAAEGKSPPTPKPADTKPAATKPADTRPADTKPADTEPTQPPGSRLLYQEVLIARRPSFNVSGVTISQDLQYRVISKLYVGTRASDGTLQVKQVIYETKLEKSDNLSRDTFAASLKAMRGQEFRYTLGKDNEIVKFAGPKDTRKVVKADGLGGEGFLLSSVMDDDGWKELAQLSFFLPPSPLKRGERFERKLTHNWGALGSWYGKTIYTPTGERSGEQRIDYAHYLHYVAPEKKAAELPFVITAASFKIDQAAGSIQWDPKTARIVSAMERFVVRGTVTTQVLGQSVEAQVEESQAFALRVMDKLPSETGKGSR